MKAIRSLLIFFARIAIAAIFIFSGASKIMFYDQTAQYMAAKGFTYIPVFLIGAAIVELVGGLCLLLGYKTRFGAALLLLFLIPTTLIFHNFWGVPEGEKMLQQIMFLKNLAIFGGLIYVLCDGAAGCSVDACCRHKEPEEKVKEKV